MKDDWSVCKIIAILLLLLTFQMCNFICKSIILIKVNYGNQVRHNGDCL